MTDKTNDTQGDTPEVVAAPPQQVPQLSVTLGADAWERLIAVLDELPGKTNVYPLARAVQQQCLMQLQATAQAESAAKAEAARPKSRPERRAAARAASKVKPAVKAPPASQAA